MEDRFSSTFFIRKSRSKKSNKCDIYLRITANGKRSDMSINRKIDEDKWNKRSSRFMGRNHDSDMVNTYISQELIFPLTQRFRKALATSPLSVWFDSSLYLL